MKTTEFPFASLRKIPAVTHEMCGIVVCQGKMGRLQAKGAFLISETRAKRAASLFLLGRWLLLKARVMFAYGMNDRPLLPDGGRYAYAFESIKV